MKIEDFIIEINHSIYEAMEYIDNNSKGIVYVTKNNELYGVITDGDIRRYILQNGRLEEQITDIVNLNCFFLFENEEKNVYSELQHERVQSIPIVNFQKEIIKIYFTDCKIEKRKELNVPVVVMAGGKGTRLYPYTQILPKPLIPIGDKTITEHIMDRFEECGCRKFSMIINYKKHFIKSYFEDNESNRNITFVEETEFLGTGGGLKLISGNMHETFFMTNCDILIEEDYSKILTYHKKKKNIVTMVCAVKNIMIPYGTVEETAEGKVIGLKEKPEISFITNTGFYVLEPEFLEFIPSNTFIHITDVIQKCIDDGKNVGVYKIGEECWLDMGQLEELEKMKEKLNVK